VASLEITSTHELDGEIVAFHIDPRSAVAGQPLSEVPFPPAAAAMLIIRGRELVAPRGATVFETGDHVYVFFRPEDRGIIHLLFGRQEST
jgi:cell volume regulation protein A